MEKALLVSIELKNETGHWRIEDISSELEELVFSAGLEVVDNIICLCERPSAKYLIGKGKVEEIGFIAGEENVDAVIFSHDLSGTQQRNLETAFGRKTIDRTQLILDIFSRRARSPEGKTQVELALLQYLLPRLKGKGVMLSDLGGGIGTRGPGETKLETDRRQVRKKIDKLKQDLQSFQQHRQTLKKRRKSNNLPLVALVGYTSAGKSTLLNLLTYSNQDTSDKLFTTLDPVAKNFTLPDGQEIVVSDTVGFLHQLPHHLIEAFKATLEEVLEADLLVHVLDVSDPRLAEHNQAVNEVLEELGVGEKSVLQVLNKIDLIDNQGWPDLSSGGFADPVQLSAKTGENLDLLVSRIAGYFADRLLDLKLVIPNRRMDLVNYFYRNAQVKEIEYRPDDIRIRVGIGRVSFNRIQGDKDIAVIY